MEELEQEKKEEEEERRRDEGDREEEGEDQERLHRWTTTEPLLKNRLFGLCSGKIPQKLMPADTQEARS